MTVDVIHADCLDVLPTLPACSFDAIVTDPPYGLGFMGKKWDTPGALVERPADTSQKWDHVGGNHNPADSKDAARTRRVEGQKFQQWCTAWAREVFRVLKPGGHLLAFGGARTYHRLACAIEDGGFEIRDQIMWLYGSGFPKSLNLEDEWDGWGTALKPAHEPLVLARKPLVGTVAENVAAHGCGVLNIDGCRIGTESTVRTVNILGVQQFGGENHRPQHDDVPRPRENGSDLGRWPANVAHDGSEEVVACFPDAPGQIAAESFTAPSSKTRNVYGERGRRPGGFGNVGADKGDAVPNGPLYGDTGSAARFFYCAKASKEDRDEGCDILPSIERVNGNKWTDQDYRVARGERSEGRESGPRANFHPTVKPTSLMRWLCRLVTPPGGKVLDMFAGSGSTGKACELEGFDCVLIEGEADYIPIIHARIAFAREERRIATAQQSLFA